METHTRLMLNYTRIRSQLYFVAQNCATPDLCCRERDQDTSCTVCVGSRYAQDTAFPCAFRTRCHSGRVSHMLNLVWCIPQNSQSVLGARLVLSVAQGLNFEAFLPGRGVRTAAALHTLGGGGIWRHTSQHARSVYTHVTDHPPGRELACLLVFASNVMHACSAPPRGRSGGTATCH